MGKENCDESNSCDTCETGSTCSAQEKEEHEQARLQQKLSCIRHKIMVMSGKGGVGKSTVSVNFAASLALQGYEVGVLDADIHGPDIPRMCGVENRPLVSYGEGLEPIKVFKGLKAISTGLLSQDPDKAIVWRGPLKHSAIRQFLGDVNWGDLDYLVIDLPPGTGDEPLSVAHLIQNVDGAIIVTTPQDVALLDSRKAVNFSRLLNIPVLGIVQIIVGESPLLPEEVSYLLAEGFFLFAKPEVHCCPLCGRRPAVCKLSGVPVALYQAKALPGVGWTGKTKKPYCGVPLERRWVEVARPSSPTLWRA